MTFTIAIGFCGVQKLMATSLESPCLSTPYQHLFGCLSSSSSILVVRLSKWSEVTSFGRNPTMRDPERITDVLAHVEELWRQYPDWRLGQLLCNVAAWADPTPEATWVVEDDEVVEQIERHLQKLTSSANP